MQHACLPLVIDHLSARAGISGLSPLALSPQNATMVVSALNTLICLASPHFSERLSLGDPECSFHSSHAGCFVVSDELRLRGQQGIVLLFSIWHLKHN